MICLVFLEVDCGSNRCCSHQFGFKNGSRQQLTSRLWTKAVWIIGLNTFHVVVVLIFFSDLAYLYLSVAYTHKPSACHLKFLLPQKSLGKNNRQSFQTAANPSLSIPILKEGHLFVTSVPLCINEEASVDITFLPAPWKWGLLSVTTPFNRNNDFLPWLLCPDIELSRLKEGEWKWRKRCWAKCQN